MLEFERPELTELKPRITVVGVGGAGCNAVANMINADLQGVDFIVANTDAQALNASPAERRIQLGPRITEYSAALAVIADQRGQHAQALRDEVNRLHSSSASRIGSSGAAADGAARRSTRDIASSGQPEAESATV